MENKIKKLNEAMFNEVMKKKEELPEGKAYRFDFDSKKRVPVNENGKDEISDDQIEYYWVEYEENGKQMKLALFFKDVDINTHNVHVIPGLIEKYELRDDHPEGKPYAQADIKNGKVFIKNEDKLKDIMGKVIRYPSFAEQRGDGKWWCPQSDRIPISDDGEIIESEGNSIKDLKKLLIELDLFEFEISENIAGSLKGAEKVQEIKPGRPTAKRYIPLRWYNIYLDGERCYSILLTKPIYFQGYGFFTQYHCINFAHEGILIDSPVVGEETPREKYEAPFSLPKSLNEEDKPTEKELETLRKGLENFMSGKTD